MNRSEAEEIVKQIVCKALELSDDEYDASEFLNDMGADSMGMVEILMEIECVGKLVPSEVWERIMTPNDIVDLIEQDRR